MVLFLFMIVGIPLCVLYVAWINGVFYPCPYCSKRGSWHFKKVGAAQELMDKDGATIKSTQKLLCTSCQQEVVCVWSDSEGKKIIKSQ